MDVSRFITCCSIFACTIFCAINANAQETEEKYDEYTIVVDPQAGTFDIEAHLYHLNSQEIICEPAYGQRYGEHISSVSMKTPDGIDALRKRIQTSINSQVHSESPNTGCYTGVNSDIVVKYSISQSKLSDNNFWIASNLSPIHREHLLAIPGISLFIERNAFRSHQSLQKTKVNVRYKGQLISTLNPITQLSNEIIIQNKPGLALTSQTTEQWQNQIFIANDTFELTRSYWTFGQFHVIAAASDKISWQLAFFPDEFPNAAIIQREITQILDNYSELLPLKTPKHLAVFLFSAPFDAGYHHGFARPGGIILQMGKKSASQTDTRRILIAHELFHQYNGENLRYAPEKYDETSWIREGMTQFIAFKTLLSLGLITQQQLYDWMAYSIQKQSSSQYDEYHHGFFISQAIEQQWAIYHTGYSLRGFWKWMHDYDEKQHTWATTLYTNSDFQNLLMLYSAFDFSLFFKKYIQTKGKLPIDDLLKLAGLCKYSAQEITHSIGIDYQLDPQNALLRIQSIDLHGPAAQAGIKKDDIIIPEPDIDWTDSSDKKLTVIRNNSKLQLRIPAVTIIRSKLSINPCK